MLKNKTVLVVEDNATVRRFTASVLKNQLNCSSVIQASSANEALETIKSLKLRRGALHLILSDWEMPGMSGDEFLLAVRENPETADTPFIMVTARNDRDSIIMAAQAGVSEYIIKPFTAAALLQKITRAFDLQERRAMARFKTASGDKAEVIFTETNRYNAAVVNISQTGVLLRTPLFRHAPVCVHDMVKISLHLASGAEIQVLAELVRMETDKDNLANKNLMLAGFQFQDLDEASAEKLRTSINNLPEVPQKPITITPTEKPLPVEKRPKRLDMDM